MKPTTRQLYRWRKNLAEERAEEAAYRQMAADKTGRDREILLGLAEAEKRHQRHWETLLGDQVGSPVKPRLRTRCLGFLGRHFGSLFALALMQYSEQRVSQGPDEDATFQMAADEQVHGEVVRALAAKGRSRLSGPFRAAVFGINDGLVSNLALVMGVGGAGSSSGALLLTGLAGVLAGGLSMGAGEYVSVISQRELLASSQPDPQTSSVIQDLDINANELELVFRARGMSEAAAAEKAETALMEARVLGQANLADQVESYAELGTPWKAAISSFIFFSIGAMCPVLPFIFGLSGTAALLVSLLIVGINLFITGACVGLFSGARPARRGLRQLCIGFGAAGITYALGLLAGGALG